MVPGFPTFYGDAVSNGPSRVSVSVCQAYPSLTKLFPNGVVSRHAEDSMTSSISLASVLYLFGPLNL